MLTNDSITYQDTLTIFEPIADTLTYRLSYIDSLFMVNLSEKDVDLFSPALVIHQPFISDWMVIVILLMFGLLAWVKATSYPYLVSLLQSGFNIHTASRLFREKAGNIVHPSFRIDTLFFLTTATYLMHFRTYIPELFKINDVLLFLIILAVVYVFVNGKFLVYSLIGFLFKTGNETGEFIFYSMTGCRIMGIFLLPVVSILFFLEGKMHFLFMVFGFSIVALFSIISLYRGIRIIASKDFSIYYLILYLCTVEILPLFLIWRMLR